MGVSKYAANRQEAIVALLELADQTHDRERLLATNSIPSHLSVSEQADVKARTSLLTISSKLMKDLVSRPSGPLGNHYDEASREYASAVNSVLRHQASPEKALADLENKLVELTGLPVQPN